MALVAGAILRAASLPAGGTPDVDAWKTWSYHAITGGVTRIYGVGAPFTPPALRFGDRGESQPDYPPLAMDELAAVGYTYRWLEGGRFPDTTALTVALRASIVLMDIGLLLVVALAVRRDHGAAAAWWAAMIVWLNPAMLLDTTLGYIDAFYMLPLTAGLVSAMAGQAMLAGALTAAAVMTKPQALFAVPAIAIGIWNAGDPRMAGRRIAMSFGAAAAVVIALVAPIAVAGGARNVAGALASTTNQDMVSGNAANLWWMAGHIGRALSRHGAAALTLRAEIVPMSAVTALGYPSPRTLGAVLWLIVMAWALWTTRRARLSWLVAALAAFLLHAYATLFAFVHENHLVGAIPFLVLAAAGRRRFRPLLAAISAIVALNLYLFYGVTGDGPLAAARTLTGIDATIVLAALNCGVLVWFGVELKRAAEPRTGG